MNQEEDLQMRKVPVSELDFNSQLANPLWGQDIENIELKKKLSSVTIVKDKVGSPIFDKEGNPIAEEESEYETLSFLNRDFRLGNLDRKSGEVDYCIHWTELAHDCLQLGMKKSHSASLSRVAVRLELSQSIHGFFRKIMNTFRQEIKKEEAEPPKKKLFGTNQTRHD